MKKEEVLLKSYQKQKGVWEESHKKKLENIQSSISSIEVKIEKLEAHLRSLKESETRLRTEDFESFQSFRQRSESQSSQSQAETGLSS